VQCRSFLEQCFQREAARRPDVAVLLLHPFVAFFSDAAMQRNRPTSAGLLQSPDRAYRRRVGGVSSALAVVDYARADSVDVAAAPADAAAASADPCGDSSSAVVVSNGAGGGGGGGGVDASPPMLSVSRSPIAHPRMLRDGDAIDAAVVVIAPVAVQQPSALRPSKSRGKASGRTRRGVWLLC
jgi:hypothetical protein